MDGSNWRQLYRAAILEVNMDKLGERVKAAAQAIRSQTSPDGAIPNEERIAFHDAMNALNMLKRERR